MEPRSPASTSPEEPVSLFNCGSEKSAATPMPMEEKHFVLIEGQRDDYIDPRAEKKLLRKLDLTFTPIFMLLYLTCFLDRSNIGNVKVAGMPASINATSSQFSIAISIFYATYIALETPAPILMNIITPRLFLTLICIVWSLTTIFTGLVTNIGGLYATRLILGCCEAGLFPCLNLYLTMIYARHEMAKRVSYLFVCAALSGAFGGLLAYGLLQMNGVAGQEGWRWVYIIEGCMSITCVLVIWFGLPNDPTTAYFLSDAEKELMRRRAKQRAQYMGSEIFDWQEVKIALSDPKLYISGLIQFCQDILLYGFSTFLPSILSAMNYDTLHANLLTIPVYLLGGLIFLLVAIISDKLQQRGFLIFLANIFGIVGYILLLTVSSTSIQYFATYLCAVAVYVGPGLNLAWLNVNIAPHYRRATAIGAQQSMGNAAGLVAGQIYRSAPYTLGNAFSLAALCVAELAIVSNMWYLRRENRVRRNILKGERVDERRVRTGDGEVEFVYHI